MCFSMNEVCFTMQNLGELALWCAIGWVFFPHLPHCYIPIHQGVVSNPRFKEMMRTGWSTHSLGWISLMSRKPRQRGGSGWIMRMVKKTPASGRYRFNHVYMIRKNFVFSTTLTLGMLRLWLYLKPDFIWTSGHFISILYQFILVFKATFRAKNWETMPGGLEVPQSHRSAFGQGSAPKSRLWRRVEARKISTSCCIYHGWIRDLVCVLHNMLKKVYSHSHIYIYIPGTQMTLVLIGKDLLLRQNKGPMGSRFGWILINSSSNATPRRYTFCLKLVLPSKAQEMHHVPPAKRVYWAGCVSQQSAAEAWMEQQAPRCVHQFLIIKWRSRLEVAVMYAYFFMDKNNMNMLMLFM